VIQRLAAQSVSSDLDGLPAQVPHLRVSLECGHCPTVWFDERNRMPVLGRDAGEWFGAWPFKLYGKLEDGARVFALLHFAEGRPQELEVFREDSADLPTPPAPEILDLVDLDFTG
jgi:hypothetical protein